MKDECVEVNPLFINLSIYSMQFCELDIRRFACAYTAHQELDECLQTLVTGEPLNEDHANRMQQFYKKIKPSMARLSVTEEPEQLSIVEASGLSRDHCFKCPNGKHN